MHMYMLKANTFTLYILVRLHFKVKVMPAQNTKTVIILQKCKWQKEE